jgi:hypothetical protein
MVSLRDTLSSALNEDRLLALAVVVLCLESLARVALHVLFSSLWLVAWPPVIAIVVLGGARAAARGQTADGPNSPDTVGRWLRLSNALFGVAVGGHACALAIGTAVFLVVDTPIRWALYWVGVEPLATDFVALGVPMLGITAGTAFAWAVPATVAADISAGTSVPLAVKRGVARLQAPRAVGTVGLATLLVPASLVVAVLATFGVVSGVSSVLGSQSPLLFYAVLCSLVVLCGSPVLAVAARASVEVGENPDGAASGADTTPAVPVVRLGVVILLVVSLATAAGAIRATELRPTDTDPEPFGENPQDIYATAVDNTLSQSHAVTVRVPEADDATVYYDFNSRQVVVPGLPEAYESIERDSDSPDGIIESLLRLGRDVPAVNPVPLSGEQEGYDIPQPGETEWTVTEQGAIIRLASTDINATLRANDIEPTWVKRVQSGEIVVTVDRETNALTSVEYAYNVTLSGDDYGSGEPVTVTTSANIEYETGVSVTRPDELGSRSVEQRIWKVLLY